MAFGSGRPLTQSHSNQGQEKQMNRKQCPSALSDGSCPVVDGLGVWGQDILVHSSRSERRPCGSELQMKTRLQDDDHRMFQSGIGHNSSLERVILLSTGHSEKQASTT